MSKEALCKQCGNVFKKGEGGFIPPKGGLSNIKATHGYCGHCLDAFANDVNYQRWGSPKSEHLRGTHNDLIRHFGKVPNQETEPDFRQTTKIVEKKPEKPELYNSEKYCAFCSGEFKKGEKIKKHLGEYPVHQKCSVFPSFKDYLKGRK